MLSLKVKHAHLAQAVCADRDAAKPPTLLSGNLLSTSNTPMTLANLIAALSPPAADEGIPPPVLHQKVYGAAAPDFINQQDLDRRWGEFQQKLKTATLSEDEVLAVLKSGMLQTVTGNVIAGLFAEAMLRSIRPVKSLNGSRLEGIVDVLCHLPPAQWQSAMGENVRFPSAIANKEGVTGFIQSQLDRSSDVRDERIANGELLSDDDWQTLKNLKTQGLIYIRKTDGDLYDSLTELEDEPDVRPTAREAHGRLAAFADQLATASVQRARWSHRYAAAVSELRNSLDPDQGLKPSWWDWLDGPGWVEGLRGRPGATITAEGKKPSDEKSVTWPLSDLQAFERSADFYAHVATGDAGVPQGLFARFLYACNVLNTFNLLKLNDSHITTRPGPKPSGDAWKNGAAGVLKFPTGLGAPGSQPAVETDPLALLGQFVTRVDALFTQVVQKIVPWESAFADEVIVMEEMATQVYGATTEVDPTTFSAQVELVREQASSLLARMSSHLLATGAAALGQAGELIVQNPVKATGLVGLYLVLQQLCTRWLLPEPEPLVDPLQGLVPNPQVVPDEASVTHDNIMKGIQELFDDLPTFAEEVERLVNQSDEFDPADDPEVLAGIETLLREVAPDQQNATYQDYLDRIILSATFDAQDEFLDKLDNGSTNTPGEPYAARMRVADEPTGKRTKRSLIDSSELSSNVRILDNDESDHSTARLLIHAGQQAADARIPLQPDEELAPGITVKHIADRFIEALTATQMLSDPLLFMDTLVEGAIQNSGLPKDISSTLSPKTKFKVEFNTPRPISSPGNYFPNNKIRSQTFTLWELFAGQHEKARQTREEIKICWPPGYTADFIDTVADNNFPEKFEEKAQEVIAQPAVADLWKANKKLELQKTIESYSRSSHATATGKSVATSFLSGNTQVRAISIKNGPLSGLDHVTNAVYVHPENSAAGLFVFLGGDGKVIECPPDLFSKGGPSIEEFPELRNELSKRIPINALLSRSDDDFKYSGGKFELKDPHWTDFLKPLIPTLIGLADDVKTPYWPIVLGRADGAGSDLFDELHHRQTEKMLSDIDTLTSTSGERLTDVVLELLAYSLAMASLTVGGPSAGAVAKALAVLFGIGSSVADYSRGLNDGDPNHSDQHKANGIRGAIFELAGPFAGKMLGKGISVAVKNRIAGTILDRLKSLGHLPPEVIKYLPKFDMPRLAVKGAKWIPPKVLDPDWLNAKLVAKFEDYRVINKLNNLAKGPHIAQKLMDTAGVVFYQGKKSGYVYKGFVMRGDMRAPEEVFSEGFKLRTPITDIKQVNGMNGGFGGGKNALDPDGMGVSTSRFYSDSGAGAYHYGGGKGGYTYLIDTRQMMGFDLYRNHNLASIKPAQIGFKPWEINYGRDIPGSNILGAYDPSGKFIPNPRAINRSIALSKPEPLKVPMPFKWMVKDKNFSRLLTSTTPTLPVKTVTPPMP